MLDSSLWPEKDQRDLFITALLMAEPFELLRPSAQIKVRSLESTGFEAPAGWYGIIRAAGIGIINRCNMDSEKGLCALEKLGDPDPESRSSDFEGRRLIRIDGGYLALNYDKYRERDYSNAERCKRYREKKKSKDMPCQTNQHACQHASDMQAEAEAEAYNKTSAISILEALNAQAGTSFRPVKGTIAPILARLKDGATTEDCLLVISSKVAEWKNKPDMSPYLRPSTLFRAKNFEEYLGIAKKPKNKVWVSGESPP